MVKSLGRSGFLAFTLGKYYERKKMSAISLEQAELAVNYKLYGYSLRERQQTLGVVPTILRYVEEQKVVSPHALFPQVKKECPNTELTERDISFLLTIMLTQGILDFIEGRNLKVSTLEKFLAQQRKRRW